MSDHLADLLFDDTYQGPRFVYGLVHRPVSTYNLPDGFILRSQRAHPSYPAFGTIAYPRELSESETAHYSLVRVEDAA